MSRQLRLGFAAVAALIVAAAGYYGYRHYSAQSSKPQAQAAPPPEVGVLDLKRANVPLPLTYAGRVAGFRQVEVRPQVTGLIVKREYNEGSTVKQGDVLFRIDQRTYQAVLDRAQGQLAQAQATQVQADENFNRINELASKQVATAKQLDDARAARDQARAAVQSAQAEVETARLNIEFTTIRAPVTGPTTFTSPAEGSLAQAQQTLLTTITQLDPAYVNFSVSESEFVDLRDLNNRRDKPLTPQDVTVTLSFADGSKFPRPGKVNVSSSTVDPRSGTIQIRAIFENDDGGLLPNQFVRVHIEGVTLQNVFVVPQMAVSQGPQGPFVYVINAAGNGVESRPIKLEHQVQGGWGVESGINDGERLVVDGLVRIRPGQPVKPVPYSPPKSDKGPPAGASAGGGAGKAATDGSASSGQTK